MVKKYYCKLLEGYHGYEASPMDDLISECIKHS